MKYSYMYALLVGLLCMACGADDDSPDTQDSNTATAPAVPNNGENVSDADSSGEMNVSAADDAVADGPSAEEQPACVADAPGELCVRVTVPEDVPSVPEKVSVHFFPALPPMGPPAILGAEIAEASELAQFQPGATVALSIAGLPANGEMYLYGVLYMPGGGAQTWQTVPGVDFHGAYSWDEPVQFTGEPIELDAPITFTVYAE